MRAASDRPQWVGFIAKGTTGSTSPKARELVATEVHFDHAGEEGNAFFAQALKPDTGGGTVVRIGIE